MAEHKNFQINELCCGGTNYKNSLDHNKNMFIPNKSNLHLT